MDATSLASTTMVLARADYMINRATTQMQAQNEMATLKDTPLFSMEPPKQ